MDKIRIVFLLGTLELGGTERQFLELVRRLNRDRFDLRVLAFHCQGNVRTAIEACHIPFTCLNFSGLKGKFRPESYLQLYRLIRDMVQYFKQEHPQIVQSFLYWTNIYGSLAAKIAGVPIIITGRRATMEEKYKTWFGQWLQNFSNLWATAIITNSAAVRDECLQRDAFVTKHKIQVIYNGIDVNCYVATHDPITTKQHLYIPEHVQIVGIIASLQPRKGHRDFLRAAVRVLQTCPNTVFLIIGRDDGSRSELEAFTETLGIRDTVIFTGERSDIPDMLAMLDVQVSSSFIEGVSNALLEGMAAGKPIVATAMAGNPEIVAPGQTGFLVPPSDPDALAEAIIRLLTNRELRMQMGMMGRQRVETIFRMQQMVQQTEALYQKLVTDTKLS
jgi:glycosyltransferase involved in cell wall biosynthesis